MKTQRVVSLVILAVVLVREASAQAGGWSNVESLKVGTTVVVGTLPSGYLLEDHCKLQSVDATTLTCQVEGKNGARLVYPMREVESVQRVKGNLTVVVAAVAAFVGAGVLFGFLLSGSSVALGILMLGGIVAFVVIQVADTQRTWYAWHGIPPEPRQERRERRVLVYRRAHAPGPAAGASM